MRVVFMGTPEAAVPSLEAVADHHDVPAVYTRPDKPRGRGRRLSSTPVKETAAARGLSVVEPSTLRDPGEHERLRALAPDAIAVVAFGYLLPAEVLAIPRAGCVNVHFSLLPRWRGAAPVARAISAGDEHTGITTMLMDEGLDTGPILLQEAVPIHPDDTAGALTERLAHIGARLLVETLDGLAAGRILPQPQPDEGVSTAPRIEAAETELDFREDADALARRIRALEPEPGAAAWFRGRRLKIRRAEPRPGAGEPGTIAGIDPAGPLVQTGEGRLLVVEAQPEGKRRMSGEEFLRGYRPQPGERVQRPPEAGG